MDKSSGWNMYVFRDGRQCVEGEFLLDGLRSGIEELQSNADSERKITALLWAGEVECALADVESKHGTAACEITDALASYAVSGQGPDLRYLLGRAEKIHCAKPVSVSPPEGFAFYALHPLNFAELARQHSGSHEVFAVVGVRSIGTTLSSIVAAALREGGNKVERTTVRPKGHPYDRYVQLSADQCRWAERLRDAGARFIVVDEGPGISGSSLLAAGEAFVRCGIASERVTFFCSRPIDPHRFVAPNAVERYSKFGYFNSPYACMLPERGDKFIGNGFWRAELLPKGESWPGSWTNMERSKFLRPDGTILKFHGYGRFGREVSDRLETIAAAGFGPEYLGSEEGFGQTRLVPGRHAVAADLSPELLRRMAAYCAFRTERMRSERASTSELEKAVRTDWEFEFGVPLKTELNLDIVRPVIADSKMQPHEWIVGKDSVIKTDSEFHGDDHFFPGPTDIAWDLAGLAIEWEMEEESVEVLIREYQRLTGDDPGRRFSSYLLAYSVFRFAYCKMGSQATAGTIDEALLRQDYERYRRRASQHVWLNRSCAA